jgi:hypothetical protein
MQVQPFSLSQDQTANGLLAEKIIAEGKKDNFMSRDVKEICSGDFLQDPITHLVNEMIFRGVGMCREDDSARAFVISRIPGFIEKVSSMDYLKSFAEIHYKGIKDNTDKLRIMQVFEKSLKSKEFQKDLKAAVKSFNLAKEDGNYYYAEDALRIALTIYRQAAQLQEYSYPEEASSE